jgi:hypothetical protein
MAHDAHRENLLRRIRLLTEKTVENGCTEAEAMAAAELVDRLLREHDATLEEATMAAEKISVAEVRTGKRVRHPVDMVVPELGLFTGTLFHVTNLADGEGLAYRFIGLRADAVLADHLLKVIYSAMEGEVFTYLAKTRAERGTSIGDGLRRRHSFLHGMATRVVERLRELREAREKVVMSSGRDLVVVKNDLVVRRAREVGFVASEVIDVKFGISSSDAYDAGMVAGDRVGLGSPVEDRRAPVALLPGNRP